MKENAIKSINKFGKIGSVVVTIAKVLFIAAFIFTVLGAISFSIIPEDFIRFSGAGAGTVTVNVEAIGETLTKEQVAEINNSKNMGGGSVTLGNGSSKVILDEIKAEGNTITITGSGNADNFASLHDLVYVLIAALIALAVTIVSLFFAGFLCKAFKECESPFEENVINKMKNFAYSLIPWVILSSIVDSMFSSIMAGRFDVSLSLDIKMIIVVLIILALVQIFKYGAILQQESDETL